MKKIIKDLAKQSGIDVYGLGKDHAKWESKLETFANLIIQECLLALEPDPYGQSEPEAYDVEEMLYNRSAKKIKDHFCISH